MTQPKERQKSRPWVRPAILGLLLLTAGFLLMPGQTALPPQATPTPQPTPDARDARESAYEKDTQALTRLVEDETLDSETRQEAARRLSRLLDEHQQELNVQRALEVAGYAVSVVLLQNGALTVALDTPEVTAELSAAILSLCLAHTDVGAENIRIMPSGS